jgi:hypothetical protein
MGVVSEKTGFDGGWVWRFPAGADNANDSDSSPADLDKAPMPGDVSTLGGMR